MTRAESGIVVRRIKARDFHRVLQIMNLAFQKEVEMLGLDASRLLRFKRINFLLELAYRLLDFLHRGYQTVLVAVLNNIVVGEVHLSPVGNAVWTIDSLAVDPAYSRQGTGQSLITESISYAKKRGARKIFTSIRSDNTPAIRISKKLGHEIYEERITLLCELGKLTNTAPPTFTPTIHIRKATSKDAQQIYELAKTTDPIRIQTYETGPKDFNDSLLQVLTNRLLGVQSQRLVAQVENRVKGYMHVVSTSPKEAARIEALYVTRADASKEITEALLQRMITYLLAKRITKVTVNLSTSDRQTIDTLIQLDFRQIGMFHGLVCL